MLLKFLNECDFINYKKPAMYLGFPRCSFKCGKEYCQNYSTRDDPDIVVDELEIINRYINNTMTEAIVCGGFEPFDTVEDLISFIEGFRQVSSDDIVIYTGYTEDELINYSEFFSLYNIIVKFGRYVPGQTSHFDETLGVMLASNNQYAKQFKNERE